MRKRGFFDSPGAAFGQIKMICRLNQCVPRNPGIRIDKKRSIVPVRKADPSRNTVLSGLPL